MPLDQEQVDLIRKGEQRLRELSPERLKMAIELLTFLKQQDEKQSLEEWIKDAPKGFYIKPSDIPSGYKNTSINHDRVLAGVDSEVPA